MAKFAHLRTATFDNLNETERRTLETRPMTRVLKVLSPSSISFLFHKHTLEHAHTHTHPPPPPPRSLGSARTVAPLAGRSLAPVPVAAPAPVARPSGRQNGGHSANGFRVGACGSGSSAPTSKGSAWTPSVDDIANGDEQPQCVPIIIIIIFFLIQSSKLVFPFFKASNLI